MKTAPAQTTARRAPAPTSMTKVIANSLKQARGDAVKTARMHHTPIVYLRNGKIVSEHPANAKS